MYKKRPPSTALLCYKCTKIAWKWSCSTLWESCYNKKEVATFRHFKLCAHLLAQQTCLELQFLQDPYITDTCSCLAPRLLIVRSLKDCVIWEKGLSPDPPPHFDSARFSCESPATRLTSFVGQLQELRTLTIQVENRVISLIQLVT